MDSVVDIAGKIEERAKGHVRFVVALAGPPGSGKSTLSELLADALGDAAILQGDGFHYDNAILDALGRHQRKGAPDTFDVAGLESVVMRVRAGGDVVVPVFDRPLDLARAGAARISADARFVIVEGNYLTLDAAPWSALRPLFDLTVLIDVPRAELEKRLMRRWLDLGWSADRAAHWVASNDMPNVDLVKAHGASADIVWRPHVL
ncbi:nucleoside/nucleotide kinase family protein [Mesorhizobium sp. YIM 152430]|uniref:nucleoside/nucleotide kinase family protein n=1 Tax=Mesorhizobium sp. YIM 152430 TaxID=3031761 RepID=UPI0023D9FE53|nr:nucleoside/nucleotide kinase family protein [Mesorhizobium sp. YIM 152430]MDF1601616.1 nucleoside/nucleotide kinase family protein [Mesorhizobium sp. YIM 152430]